MPKKNITLSIQAASISQTNPAMPKSLYPVEISDGSITRSTLDPLGYLIEHIDSISQFTIYVKNSDGSTKEIFLPIRIQRNILAFIKNHQDSSKWCCQDFTAAAHGLYQQGQQDFVSGHWKISYVTEARLDGLEAGDFVGMEGGYIDGHAALYLGEGFYLSKLGYTNGLAICKLEDMKKPHQTLFKYTPNVMRSHTSTPSIIPSSFLEGLLQHALNVVRSPASIPSTNPNLVLAKKINEIAVAVIKGFSGGLTDIFSLVLHPLDNVVYPISALPYDALIIASVHNEVLEPHALFAMNSPQYIQAAMRMAERINGLSDIYKNGKEAFLKAPLELQVELLSRAATNLLVPGKIFSGLKTIYAGARNYATLGVFKNPPLFLNTVPEVLNPNLKWSPLTIDQIKLIRDTTKCIYVITEERELIIAPRFLDRAILDARGMRSITEIHHHELGKLRPTIAAGELTIENGAITCIDNMSGHYLPSGPKLQTIVENIFKREGYVTTGLYEEAVWVQHYSDLAITQQVPLANRSLNPFVKLAFLISAATNTTSTEVSASAQPSSNPHVIEDTQKKLELAKAELAARRDSGRQIAEQLAKAQLAQEAAEKRVAKAQLAHEAAEKRVAEAQLAHQAAEKKAAEAGLARQAAERKVEVLRNELNTAEAALSARRDLERQIEAKKAELAKAKAALEIPQTASGVDKTATQPTETLQDFLYNLALRSRAAREREAREKEANQSRATNQASSAKTSRNGCDDFGGGRSEANESRGGFAGRTSVRDDGVKCWVNGSGGKSGDGRTYGWTAHKCSDGTGFVTRPGVSREDGYSPDNRNSGSGNGNFSLGDRGSNGGWNSDKGCWNDTPSPWK